MKQSGPLLLLGEGRGEGVLRPPTSDLRPPIFLSPHFPVRPSSCHFPSAAGAYRGVLARDSFFAFCSSPALLGFRPYSRVFGLFPKAGRTQNEPRIDPERTQNEPRTNPERTQNEPRTNPERTQNEPRTNPERTQNEPRMKAGRGQESVLRPPYAPTVNRAACHFPVRHLPVIYELVLSCVYTR